MIRTDFVFNDQVIGSAYERENLPTFLKIPRRRTLNQLLSIPLGPSSRIVKCVPETYAGPDINARLDEMARRSFLVYHTRANTPSPKFETWANRARYKIAWLLRKCGVIL